MPSTVISTRVPTHEARRFRDLTLVLDLDQSAALRQAIAEWCDRHRDSGTMREAIQKRAERRSVLEDCGALSLEQIDSLLLETHEDDWWTQRLLTARLASGKPELQQWTEEERPLVTDLLARLK